MVIEACIEKLTYSPFLPDVLPEVEIRSFDINSAPKAFLLKLNATVFAVSKWVSPKRTRTYPYERVYDTLGGNLKIAVIPVVKDEGAKGDRDFLQWDTVSLMSLLNVYVIFAYYVDADKSGEKITNQQLDNAYVINRIEQIQKFHSSALHWNLDELKQHFDTVLQQVQHYYNLIAEKTGVKLHSNKGIGVFRKRINNNMEEFKQFSREKAAKAQAREFTTMQPKELLSTATKAKIIIQNYLGGKYFLTVDEVKVDSEILYLMEAKHSKNALLPSKSDIKDGLLKLLLYCNLDLISLSGKQYKCVPVLKLTSNLLKGKIELNCNVDELNNFLSLNSFSATQTRLLQYLLMEAKQNNFELIIESVSDD